MKLIFMSVVAGCVQLASAAMTVDQLRCEYAVNPIGIDTLQPRLSWKLNDTARGQIQTAYQIRVGTRPESLEKGEGLLWDSDKTVCSDNVHIVYEGADLRSGMRCYWQVRAWDSHGKPTAWSKPAMWQVALLGDKDWKAKWIGLSEANTPAWSDITLSAKVTLQKEAFGILFRARDAGNGYMWQFNNQAEPDFLLRPHVQKNGQWSMLPPVSLRKVIPAGDDRKTHLVEIETRGTSIRTRVDGKLVDERIDNTFATGTVGFRADSKEVSSIDEICVTDASGKVLLNESFNGSASAFQKAKVEKGQLVLNNATLLYGPVLPKDCPRFRKVFTLDKPVRMATASVCGLGFYELYLNGKKADDRVLAPANTPYAQRLLFDTVDVTPLVKQGRNAIGIWLAPGYSDDYSQWGWKWEADKRAILQLDVVYEDGSTAEVVTDESWRAGSSPLTFASLYDGEVCDATQETPGWSEDSFEAQSWRPVRVLDFTGAHFVPNTMPPLRVTATMRPVAITEPQPGVFVCDMGQNFAGWVRVRAAGPRGTRISLRHSERLCADGMLDTFTNRRAKSTDVFILAGNGTETYEPRFTYHGFRFVEITGYPGRPTPDDITGCVVHADVEPVGTFTCSDPLVNRIYSNCVWSMRSNLMSIPTDCCMRDERTPCQMDSLAYEEAALCVFNMNRYYAKWLDDITGGRGNPDWNGDTVFLPWRLYLHDGDLRILEKHYANMRAYAEHLNAKTPGHIYNEGFGDWCPPNDGSWDGYHGDVVDVNTCLYAVLTRIVADTAALLGKAADATRFAKLSDEIAQAYTAKRYDAVRAVYGDGSQTTALLPLAFGLVPSDNRDVVFEKLVQTIQINDKGRLDTGIFGTRYLLDVLSDFGEADLGIRMLTQPDYPGFGYQIANGATTLWEQWTIKGGMNSHNHAMFAGVCSSFFTRLAGITSLKPGFAEVGIAPVMPVCLSFVEASQETVKGRVSVRWQRNGDIVSLDVTIPANATARIVLPSVDPHAAKSGGVSFQGKINNHAVYITGSGAYRFVFKQP